MFRFARAGSAALLSVAVLLAASSGALAGSLGEGGVKAPNFRAKDMNGQPVVLEDLLGKGPILIDFWATWCKPCLKEMPYIQRMHDDLSDEGLKVLAVTIDSPKTQSRVKPKVKGKKFTFTVVMDPSQDVFRRMQGKGSVPYVVVLDSEGFIRYRHTGYKPGDEKELRKVVMDLLAEGKGDADGGGEAEGDDAAGADL